MDNTSSMYLYVKLNWDANRFLPAESKDCMNSASYDYRNMSARREAQFVPMGMPTICWKTFPAKTTKMLSTKNSSILIMSSSVYLSFRMFYGRYGDLIEQYGVTLSRMLNDILTLDQQWLPCRSDFPPISWPSYRAWPSPNYEWFPWSICNGCG